jgi:ribosomal protein S18 acetylase RimI-like enzyme
MIQIRRATMADLEILTPLFDSYRQFYRLPGDLERAKRFLAERLERDQSVIFLACEADAALGFTQLYPSFSSGALAPVFILNDLFVTPAARGRGAATALLQAAAAHGRAAGAARLVLSTEIANLTAQALYERLGWQRDRTFCVYQLPL